MPTIRFLKSSALTSRNPTAGRKVAPRRKLVLAEQGVLEEGATLIPSFDVNTGFSYVQLLTGRSMTAAIVISSFTQLHLMMQKS